MLQHKLVHMYIKFHITLIVRKYDAKPNEELYTYTQFVQIAYKILSNWSYSQTQRQLFMVCFHKAACNHVHWKWDTLNTHTAIIIGYLLEVS